MKLIHTSDWHLGQQLYNYDRLDEQLEMLGRIEAVVRDERPDVLIVSGDIYHNSQPSAAVQKMFSDAVVRMRKACPSVYIVLTAGNHDSGARHEVFRTPWEALNVYASGRLDADNPENHIIRIGDKGVVIAVPFVSSRNLPEGFYQKLIDLAESGAGDLPVVLMAHTTVEGLDWTGHEGASDSCVGGIDALSLEDLGKGYDYLALGHIHRPQWVRGGEGKARYSGTPLPVSFDECYPHSVSVVEIGAKGEKPVLREVGISPLRPLVTLPLDGPKPWEEVRKMLVDFRPEADGTYLRLMVEVEDFLPATANEDARELSQAKGCRFCLIQSRRKERNCSESRFLSVDELQRESPEEIARHYAEDRGMVWDNDLAEMFREAAALVADDERMS